MSGDEKFMRAALREAEKGIGHTSPNPAVGAVVVRGGRIIARGYHHRAGNPHAEIEAIRALKSPTLANGATLYVTLEPCSTHGRTPPCCDAIRAHGFERVVIGAIDPNPKHAGRGVEILRQAGIDVSTGVLGEECADLNRAFNKWIVTGLPWVVVKAGLSLDGRFTRPPGEGRWLTSPESRERVMRLRASVDAILVGANTLRVDNPRLTIRGLAEFARKQPFRVVLTRSGNLPKNAHLFTDRHRDRTIVFQAKPLSQVLRVLGRSGVTSVLLEGGGRLMGQAFDRRLVDEAHFHLAPLLCGGPDVIAGRGAGATAESILLHDVRYTRVGDDIHVSGRIPTPRKL
jgi:diaminohydroxyphosphoribosylaminopyrimidine deaminase/5-amino-6-(5-phosphoribosylamino)uracil reductase